MSSPVLSDVSEFDLQLHSGRVRVRRSGSPTAALVLLIPGLSAHLHCFDLIVEQIAGLGLQLVCVELRGRGRSEVTPAGSYGLAAHSRDVLEIATLLGASEFDLIGWSMGALIGIMVAAQAPQRLRRLVLLDHAGRMDNGPVEKIRRGLDRLEVVVPTPADYLALMRNSGSIQPWSAFWDQYFQYELAPVDNGVQPSTSKMACLEDLDDLLHADFVSSWKQLCMPTLLIRGLVPIAGGLIVPQRECDHMRQVVPQLQVADLEVDHYIVMVSSETTRLIARFLAD